MIKINFVKPENQINLFFHGLIIFCLISLILSTILLGVFIFSQPALACHGSITIKKVTSPGATCEKFNFNGNLGNFSLASGKSKTIDKSAGTYQVTEQVKTNWQLVAINCSGGTTQVDLANRTVTIKLKDYDNVTCTFANNQEVKQPICGDGIIDQGEVCDNGQNNGQVCQADYNTTCQYCSTACQLVEVKGPYCGDGQLQGEEQCDQAGQNGQICHAAYGQTCSYCSNICSQITISGPYCGDGVIQDSEQCDGQAGVGEHQACTDNCQLIDLAYCGNGQVEDGEQCEGSQSQNCTTNIGYQGTQSCSQCVWTSCQALESCGDQIVNGPEVCDGSSQSCGLGGYQGSQTCLSDCSGFSACQTTESCGDGIKNGSEQCDGQDGLLPNHTCTAECQLQALPPADQCDSSISGRVFYHLTQEALVGWQLQLLIDGQLLATTTSDQAGNYQFDDLCFGDYLVKQQLIAGWRQISPVSPDYYQVNISQPNSQMTDRNFSNLQLNKISGYKLRDTDGNLSTAADQTSLADWLISLFLNQAGSKVLVATTSTDTAGYFEFKDLLNGEYSLTEELISGWQQLAAPSAAVLTSGDWSKNNNFINHKTEIPLQPTPPPVDFGSNLSSQPTPSPVIPPALSPLAAVEPVVLGTAAAPALVMGKTTSKIFANPGDDQVGFSIIITNNGNLNAYNLVLTDQLPTGFYFNENKQIKKSWPLGDMPPGKIIKLDYEVTVTSKVAVGKYRNLAALTADNHSPINASAEIEIRQVKVLAELAPSGFDFNELIILIITLFSLIGLGLVIKQKLAY